MSETKHPQELPKFVDFQIIQRICYLCNITNQILTQFGKINSDLEQALLQFILSFKNHVLTDSRLTALSQFAEDANGSDDGPVQVDSIEGIYNESQ